MEPEDAGGRLVDAWKAKDEKRERVREEKREAKEAARDAEKLSQANLDATVQSNAARLNRMILADLDRLEGDEGSTLELGKRSEIIKKLSDARVGLARATEETSLTLERIARGEREHGAER